MELIVKFRGGPCDGLVASNRSAEHVVASAALLWSLIAIGRKTTATIPGLDVGQRPAQSDWRTAVYEVVLRTIKANVMTSEAVYCLPAKVASDQFACQAIHCKVANSTAESTQKPKARA